MGLTKRLDCEHQYLHLGEAFSDPTNNYCEWSPKLIQPDGYGACFRATPSINSSLVLLAHPFYKDLINVNANANVSIHSIV